MIQEFAIDPEALADWQNFRYLVEKFGVSQGRLISRFPREWTAMVHRACHRCSAMEKKRIVEGLSRIDGKLLVGGRRYDRSREWIPNALSSHAEKPFCAIVTIAATAGDPRVYDVGGLGIDHQIWSMGRAARVNRTPADMSAAAKTLLECSREIVFVDPHFSGQARFRRPLAAMIPFACSGSPIARFEYHCEAKSISAEFFGGELEKLRRVCRIPLRVKIAFVRWRGLSEGDSLHARYVLTERGALRFDHGLDEGKEGETTDVECVDEGIYRKRWEQYQPGSEHFEFVDAWIVTSARVAEADWNGTELVAKD